MIFNIVQNRKSQSEKGFTLVEVLITAVILAIVLAGLSGVLRSAFANLNSNKATMQSEQPITFAMNMITRDVRAAEDVPTCSAATLTVSDAAGANVTYTFDNSDRTLKRNGVLLAENVAGTFSEVSGVYEIELTATVGGTNGIATKEVNLQSQVTKRN